MATLYAQRVAEGACGTCGKLDSAPMCTDCKADQKKRSADRREYRRANGICQQGDHPAIPGEALCLFHKEKAATAQRNRLAKRTEDGQCQDCGGKHGELAPGVKRCQHCLDRQNEGGKERYAEKKKNKICYKCDEPWAPNSTVYCVKHLREDAEAKAVARAACSEAGICTRCKKEPVVPGGKRCVACRKLGCEETAAIRADRLANGLCPMCGKTPKENCDLCQKCISKLSANASRAYFARKESGSCYFCYRERSPGHKLCVKHLGQYANYRAQTKLDVMNAYGGPVCVGFNGNGCGKTDIEVLQIDHINGGGCQERRDLGITGGYTFYLWLKRNNYPKGYRVLCADCNVKAHHAKKAEKKAAVAAATIHA